MSLQIDNLFSYELPEEVWKYIFSLIDEQPNSISCVSRVFNRIMQDSFLWANAAQPLSLYPNNFHEIAPASFSWKKVYLEKLSKNKLEQECIRDLYSYIKFVAHAVIKFTSTRISETGDSFWFYNDYLRSRDHEMAWELIEQLNEDKKIKDPQVNYYLGLRYLYGLSLEYYHDKLATRKSKEYLEAYIKKAKDPKSFSEAKYALGIWYEKNSDDLATSIGYYQDAANQNHVMAQCRLGFYYQIGKGMPIDLGKAFECYRKAADQNHPCAQYMVGRCFEFGLGTEKNLESAFTFYLTAAKQGNILAQYAVGLCYKNGRGTACKTTEVEFYCKKVWMQCEAIYRFISSPGRSSYCVKVNPLILAMGIPMPFQEVTDYCDVLGSKLKDPMAQWIHDMINKIIYYRNDGQAYPDINDLMIITSRIQADYGMGPANLDFHWMNFQETACIREEAAKTLSEKQETCKQISPDDLKLLHCHPNWECLFLQYQELIMFHEEQRRAEVKVGESLSSFVHSQINLLFEDLHVFWTDCYCFSSKYKHLSVMIDLLIKLEVGETDKFHYYLGILYEYGIGKGKNWSSAFRCYECEIANSEDAESYHHAALITQYAKEDEESAALLYRKAADRNHVMAQCRVGQESTPEEAFKWYGRAAQQSHPLAQYMMGRCLEKGMGTEINLEEAFKFYLKSAEQGHVIAQYTVSRCYEHGIGTEMNKEQSKIYDEKIWMQLMNIYKFSRSFNTLITNPFTEAMGAKIDVRDVVWYCRKLAEADNHPVAQLIFYFCYSNFIYDLFDDEGDYEPIMRDEAIKLLEVSAENFPFAQFVLGFEMIDKEETFTCLNEAFDRTDSPSLIEPWLNEVNGICYAHPPSLNEKYKELQNHLKRKYEGTEFPPSKKRRV